MNIHAKLLVRDIMSRDVVVISEEQSALEAAKLMRDRDVGSVIVVSNGKPVGIITERDLVIRVLAKGMSPESVKARDVMSTPLEFVDPNVEITEAARRMAKRNIRRLAVMEKGELVGIITSKDILVAAPALIEVLIEAARAGIPATTRSGSLAGYCDRCESWSDDLREVNGEFLCEECRMELEASSE